MEFAPLDRLLHFLSGIAWIGLLYYFNFVQVPAIARANADSGGPGPAAINKYVAPLALAWFRWAALVTWLSGIAYLIWSPKYEFWNVVALGLLTDPVQIGATTIGFGGWLGTIMLLNVWVLIWPNQKKVLGIVEATDQEKAKGKRIAFLASRTNTLLSIPMLMCMGGASHGLSW